MNAPNQYLVRCYFGGEINRDVEYIAWGFSAEDVRVQVELSRRGDSTFKGITYIGPVNKYCQCINKCRCGVEAPNQ